ncbi:MAG: hypothetical protein HQK49_12430 [Oligoflexia bacterium]|nr:hypothetical protein [Oligoflexia bacterium]
MFELIKNHLHVAIKEYSEGLLYNTLLMAKNEYFALTGIVHEESDEYEPRMNSFNDWFLFHYSPQKNGITVIQEYLAKNDLSEDIILAFASLNYSLMEFKKTNLKKQTVLKDILHDKNIIINETSVGLVEKDLFIGRIITYKEKNYLLKGICILPADTKTACSKEAKKIRKLKSTQDEYYFLLGVESLKTKWIHYGRHIEAKKIFIFNNSVSPTA